MSKIIIKREESFADGTVNYDVYLSGVFVGTLKNVGVLEMSVGVGTHTLAVHPFLDGTSCGVAARLDVTVNGEDEVVELNAADIVKESQAERANGKPHSSEDVAAQSAAEPAQTATTSQQEATSQKAEEQEVYWDGRFLDPSEREIATLGVGYVQNILTGTKVGQSSAILTEKRLYYTGVLFTGAGQVSGKHIVPVGDISMTSFIHKNNIWLKWFGVILGIVGISILSKGPLGLLLILVGVACIIKGFLGKATIFEVSFPGGRFRFNINWYSLGDVENFQRQIHVQKDRYYQTEK